MNENLIDALLKEEKRLDRLMSELYNHPLFRTQQIRDAMKENIYQQAVNYQKLGKAYWNHPGLSLPDRATKAREYYLLAHGLYGQVGADDKAAESFEQAKAIDASVASWLQGD